MASNVGTRYAAIARCFDDADCPEARKDDHIVVCGSDLYIPLRYLAAGTAFGQVGSGQYLPLDDARFMFGFPPKAEIGGAIYEYMAVIALTCSPGSTRSE